MIRREHRHWVYGIMTGWLHGFMIMTRPLHICRGLCVVVHGRSVLLQVLGVSGGLVEVRVRNLLMTGWLHGFRIMTGPLHFCRRRQGGRGRFLLCVVVHGGGVLLDLLQVLGILGGLVEVWVRDLLVGVQQLLALVVSPAEFTLDLLQIMVRVPVIVQFVMRLKHLKNIIIVLKI